MRSKTVKCKNMYTIIKTLEIKDFATNVLQSKHRTCPLSVLHVAQMKDDYYGR